MPEPTVTSVVVSFLSGSIGGSVCGAIIAHWFTTRRDRRRSKTDMMAFLNVWRSEVADNRKTPNAANVLVSYSDKFDASKRQLIEKATALESKFRNTPRTYFWLLVYEIAGMTPGGVEGDDGRQRLLDAITHLTVFVRKN